MYNKIALFNAARHCKWRLSDSIRRIILRHITTSTNITSNSSNDTEFKDNWQIVYHMPLAGLAAAFNHLKVPYGMINGVCLPGTFALEQANVLPPETGLTVAIIGISSWLTLAICSFAARNLIGFVYVNKNGDQVKLAYVDYWGKRQETIASIQDVHPYRDFPILFDVKLIMIHRDKNKPRKYKILPTFGHIKDQFVFSAIFGG